MSDPARAVVLLLHGGKPRSSRPVGSSSASWRLMAGLERRVAAEVAPLGATTRLLRYEQRGWNGGTPRVADARRALVEIGEQHGSMPVVLVGHSMGARVAVHVCDDPRVLGVVALAPWFEPDSPVAGLRGKRLRAAHARRDRITSFRATAAYVERARQVGVDASLHDMGARGHYLLSGAAGWHAFLTTSVRELLPATDRVEDHTFLT